MFMMLVWAPVIGKRGKDLGPVAGTLSLDIAKRFLLLVWGSVALFFITGIPMTIFNPQFSGTLIPDLTNVWNTAITVKHVLVGVMIIGGVVQTFTIRRMEQIMKATMKQPPPKTAGPPKPNPEMEKLMNRQKIVGIVGFICGILTLLLTAIAEVAPML